jgi:serine/threonine protein kinase
MFRAGYKVGPYTLIKHVGSGAFAEVWLAEKRSSVVSTRYALKLPIRADVNIDDIRREAILGVEAAGHINVLPVIEADSYDGRIVIVTEYVPDGSLSDWLQRCENKVSLRAAVSMISGILNGLEHLHKRRIVHRDIKPANILMQGNTPRLTDFGLARPLNASLEISQTVAGTIAYMAPEALDGHRSVRTDLWSVGVIFFRLLNGHLPFRGSDIGLITAIRSDEPMSMNPGIPHSIANVMMRALQKDPQQRYQTTTEMLTDLEKCMRASDNPTEPIRVRVAEKSIAEFLPLGIAKGEVRHINFLSDRQRLITAHTREKDSGGLGNLFCWKIVGGKVEQLPTTWEGGFLYAALADDDRTMTALTSFDSGSHIYFTLAIYILGEGDELYLSDGHRGIITAASSHDGTIVCAAYADQRTSLWFAKDWDSEYPLEQATGEQTSAVTFSPDNALMAIGTESGDVSIWKLWPNPSVALRFESSQSGPIRGLSFSRDTKLLGLASGGTVYLWNLDNHSSRFIGHCGGNVTAILFAPDSKSIITHSDNKLVCEWPLNETDYVTVWKEGACTITSINFSRDGLLIAFGCEDGSVRLHPRFGHELFVAGESVGRLELGIVPPNTNTK